MYAPDELGGLMAMMPAFTTPDGNDIRATDTIAVDNLRDGVNRMIGDGANVITTTGSFGECHTLLFDEFKTLVRATIEVVNKRVPLVLGVTSVNTRETYQKMKFVREAGGEAVLAGVPFYEPATVDNAVQFYQDIAEAFPELSIMIYHNPHNHRIHIPVRAFNKIIQNRNIVAMKDSHRVPLEMIRLHDVIHGKISHFVNQAQLYPYYELGAAGCWSIDAWMGPWPQLALLDAVRDGDAARAKEILADLTGGGGGGRPEGPSDNASKLGMVFAGYCNPGPNRPPFRVVSDAAVQRAKDRAENYKRLCEKYRPQVEARRKAAVAV